MNNDDLIRLSAVDVVKLLRAGEVSPVDLLLALEGRISTIDTQVNALPTLCFDRAYSNARALMKQPMSERGLLAGIPVTIKDSSAVEGVRTTYGSKVFANHVPEKSDIQVSHLERSGAVVYAKSNTPEFEAGANTFNEVFGQTLNPWNTSLSAAGSSGGAAVSVATGMSWLSQGSDFACSIRAPASFCGVVGLRPSPGLVARGHGNAPCQNLSVIGPIARSVEDVALFLDAMVGHEIGDPISFPRLESSYLDACQSSFAANKVAFSADLGITPVDPAIRAAFDLVINKLNTLLPEEPREAHPCLDGVHQVFRVMRAQQFAFEYGSLLKTHREEMKSDVCWNIEEGMSLTMADLAEAQRIRSGLFDNVAAFFSKYEFLITPTMIVPPYPVNQSYVKSCDGHQFNNYLEWMGIDYAVSVISCPAISLPCGFTQDGLPIGIQIVGKPRGEAGLLAFARFLEENLLIEKIVPIDPKGPR